MTTAGPPELTDETGDSTSLRSQELQKHCCDSSYAAYVNNFLLGMQLYTTFMI